MNLARMATPASQVPRDLAVTQARMVTKGHLARPAPRVAQERGALPALLVLEVSRGFPAPQVLQVPVARTERLV